MVLLQTQKKIVFNLKDKVFWCKTNVTIIQFRDLLNLERRRSLRPVFIFHKVFLSTCFFHVWPQRTSSSCLRVAHMTFGLIIYRGSFYINKVFGLSRVSVLFFHTLMRGKGNSEMNYYCVPEQVTGTLANLMLLYNWNTT